MTWQTEGIIHHKLHPHMTMDGHPDMFFFPLNHKASQSPNDFSGLRRGKLNALCTPLLNHTVSVHMPLKIIFKNRNSGCFLFENMLSITFCFDKRASNSNMDFSMLKWEVTDSGKTCTINHWLEFYSTKSPFSSTRTLFIVFETINSSLHRV